MRSNVFTSPFAVSSAFGLQTAIRNNRYFVNNKRSLTLYLWFYGQSIVVRYWQYCSCCDTLVYYEHIRRQVEAILCMTKALARFRSRVCQVENDYDAHKRCIVWKKHRGKGNGNKAIESEAHLYTCAHDTQTTRSMGTQIFHSWKSQDSCVQALVFCIMCVLLYVIPLFYTHCPRGIPLIFFSLAIHALCFW